MKTGSHDGPPQGLASVGISRRTSNIGRPTGTSLNDDRIAGGSFFARALEVIGPPYMKLLVVMVVGLLLTPQAARNSQNPTLALVLVVLCILIFAVLALALEYRDRQYRDLDLENIALKAQIRELVLQAGPANPRRRRRNGPPASSNPPTEGGGSAA